MSKLETILEQFQNALKRFEDVLHQPKNEYIRDSAIQRFEFTFDLSWKFIKVFLEENKGIICASPKGCFREAYRQGLLEYDDFWLEMTDMRNKTVHLYQEILAEEIYMQLPKVLMYFKVLLQAIKEH